MKSNVEITKKDIEKAFVRFDKGERPISLTTGKPIYHRPKFLYIINKRNHQYYSSKQIWWLASGREMGPNDYREFLKNLGYEVIDTRKVEISEHLTNNFQKRVNKSRKDSSAARRRRLKNAPKKPAEKFVLTRNFNRNPDVVAEVLLRAKGNCECCGEPGPFKRKDGSLYLEVHHRKQLAKGGNDTIENAFALCPNCHREQHYGKKPKRLIVRK